jgi:immune inhibitor A
MRTTRWRVAVACAAAASLAAAAGTAGGSAAAGTEASGAAGAPGKNGRTGGHEKPLPRFVRKWEGDRQEAADLVAQGKARPNARGVVELPNGTFVQHRLEDTEHLTVALVDFSDVTHNNIPEPDRSKDNSTYWTENFNPKHYRDMLFRKGGGSYGLPSMRDFYLEQSSGRFTWEGQVSKWTKIEGKAADFGANDPESGAGGDDLNGPVYRVVDATLKGLAASGDYGGIDLSKVDQTDRYDCDGDGNFNEPDGYFDHFGIAHAGEGEESGAAPETIWSHRWYANFNQDDGPSDCKLGGYQLPGTNLWVGDYTIEPENGAVGVFSHEFGHDLGLPDLYDTAGGENGTSFWTLMSSGSWASYAEDSIDTAPVHMGAWEKLSLGWLKLATATQGDTEEFNLGPAEGETEGQAQALRINLEPYEKAIPVFPVDGADPNYIYSDRGDDLDNTATRQLPSALGAATPVSFRGFWDIETDWDYAYLEAQVGGAWDQVETSASTSTDPHGQNFGHGITGSSNGWKTVTATLPAGATAYRFRYWTDGATARPGFAADTVKVGDAAAEDMTDVSAWQLDGFRQLANGAYMGQFDHYYLAESRSHVLGDRSLCGAYNFVQGDWLEKQCFAQGVLIWYRNTAYNDNNTSEHPGAGEILPVDLRPQAMLHQDGSTPWRNRWQSWDAPMTVDRQSIRLSEAQENGRVRSQRFVARPITTFSDWSPDAYYNPAIPQHSVRTAGSGIQLSITGASQDRGSYRLQLTP